MSRSSVLGFKMVFVVKIRHFNGSVVVDEYCSTLTPLCLTKIFGF